MKSVLKHTSYIMVGPSQTNFVFNQDSLLNQIVGLSVLVSRDIPNRALLQLIKVLVHKIQQVTCMRSTFFHVVLNPTHFFHHFQAINYNLQIMNLHEPHHQQHIHNLLGFNIHYFVISFLIQHISISVLFFSFQIIASRCQSPSTTRFASVWMVKRYFHLRLLVEIYCIFICILLSTPIVSLIEISIVFILITPYVV